jgi:hypothetical protein
VCRLSIRPPVCPISILSQPLSTTCHHTGVPHHLYGCATCHHYKGDTCHSLIGPPLPTTSLVCTPIHPVTLAVRTFPHQHQLCLPRQLYVRMAYIVNCHMPLYRLYNHHFFFMFGKMNRSPYLEHTLCLSQFKLCWVRIDEAYAHICFESIMRTLIFRPL